MDNTDLDVRLFFSKKIKIKKKDVCLWQVFIRIGHNITKKLGEKKKKTTSENVICRKTD